MQPTLPGAVRLNRVVRRQFVSFKSGAKALFIFLRGKERPITSYYEPSRDYQDYRQRLDVERQAIRQRIINSKGSPHELRASIDQLFNNLIKAGVFNPQLNDYWFEDKDQIDWSTAKFV